MSNKQISIPDSTKTAPYRYLLATEFTCAALSPATVFPVVFYSEYIWNNREITYLKYGGGNFLIHEYTSAIRRFAATPARGFSVIRWFAITFFCRISSFMASSLSIDMLIFRNIRRPYYIMLPSLPPYTHKINGAPIVICYFCCARRVLPFFS